MEKRVRIPFCGTINLFIETLTGTCFELQVSPFETVLSVKAKIQRLEGIPISQQHLIWEGTELQDDFCLHDYRIRSNATVRLVVALRGGPINTRRITVDETSFLDMADYIDANQEEILEELSIAGARNPEKNDDSQVTLLVYRNGDQVNFFRVIDRGDGSLTPISEPYRTRSLSELGNVDDIMKTPKFTKSRLTENRVTASKMKQLQTQMQHLKLKDTSFHHKTCSNGVDQQNKMSGKGLRGGADGVYLDQKNGPSQLNNDSGSYLPLLSPLKTDHVPPGKPRLPHDLRPKVSFNRHDMYLRSYGLIPKKAQDEHLDSSQSCEVNSPPAVFSNAVEFPNPALTKHNRKLPLSGTPYQGEPCSSLNSSDTRTFKAKKTLDSRSLINRFAENSNSVMDSNLPILPTKASLSMKTASSTFDNLLHPSSVPSRKLTNLADCSMLHTTEQKQQSVAMKRGPGSAMVSEFAPFNPSLSKLNAKSQSHGENICSDRDKGYKISSKPRTPVALDSSINIQVPRSYSGNSSHSSSLLPPVRPLVIKKKRCFCCGKKTGLATSYTCRCGRNFCASHRYAEAHDCTFDYKSAGRQLLKETNPIVSAPKLPKI